MRISNNQKFIDRNKKISQIILYSALGLLVLGFVWSLKNTNVEQNLTAYYILIPAYLLVQVAISMANKWGRSPRPDEIIALSLKGLNNHIRSTISTRVFRTCW
jgi:FtsH-binding integral membrane protein